MRITFAVGRLVGGSSEIVVRSPRKRAASTELQATRQPAVTVIPVAETVH
ncbi:MAG: hypothetical protein OEO23_12730 [Gemmatimonadota bacterium]|nr:hypothetical protein [Gemmatimonadota bacterium]